MKCLLLGNCSRNGAVKGIALYLIEINNILQDFAQYCVLLIKLWRVAQQILFQEIKISFSVNNAFNIFTSTVKSPSKEVNFICAPSILGKSEC